VPCLVAGMIGGADSIDDLHLLRHGAMPALSGKSSLAFTGIDSQQRRVYGHKKQGAGFGHTKIQGKSLPVRGARGRLGGCCSAEQYPVSECFHPVGGQVCVGR
jgi:hypothetical protein